MINDWRGGISTELGPLHSKWKASFHESDLARLFIGGPLRQLLVRRARAAGTEIVGDSASCLSYGDSARLVEQLLKWLAESPNPPFDLPTPEVEVLRNETTDQRIARSMQEAMANGDVIELDQSMSLYEDEDEGEEEQPTSTVGGASDPRDAMSAFLDRVSSFRILENIQFLRLLDSLK